MSPMKLSGVELTSLTLENCPNIDPKYIRKSKSLLSGIQPKHVLWSILGVAFIVVIGMIIGLIVNVIKRYVKNNVRSQSIRYININNSQSSFA